MELRLTVASKRIIEQAVSISGLTPGDLTYEAARRVLQDHERFILTDADREAFFAALRDPPPPTDRLRKAARRYAAGTR